MKYKVQELGIGGILDQAIALLKNRFGLLLGITMVLLVPFQAVFGLAALAVTPVLPPRPTAADLAQFQREFTALPLIVSSAFVLLFFVFVFPLTNAAITFAVANEYLERPASVGSSLRRSLQIALPFIGTGILFNLAVFGGMFLCVIPGILFALWFGLWGQVVAIEGLSSVEAMKRSKFLMQGNMSKLFVLGIIVGVINSLIGMIANLIPEPHLRVVISALVQGALFGFAGAAYVIFYFSCRCKAENFDLTRLADSVAAE